MFHLFQVRIEEESEKQKKQKKVSKRTADEPTQMKTHFRGNRHRRSASAQVGFQGGFSPQRYPQNFNPYQNFGQQNTAGNAVSQNQNPFLNQNTGANTFSNNQQNPFGNFQNTGGSSISSNLANGGLAGQVNAANTNQQSFQNALGFGDKNNAQSQSANFDPYGNLQATLANTGTQQSFGPNGIQNQANGATSSHNQNQFGFTDSGSQTLSETFEGNGVTGSKSQSSSHSSSVNNGGYFGRRRRSVNDRFRRSPKEEVVFPKEEDDSKETFMKKPESMKGKSEKPVIKGATTEKSKIQEKNEKTDKSGNSTNPDGLDSRFGLPGAPIATALREVVGGLLFGTQNRAAPYGAYSNGPGYGGVAGYPPSRPQYPPAPPRPYDPYARPEYYEPTPPHHHHHHHPEPHYPVSAQQPYYPPNYNRPVSLT